MPIETREQIANMEAQLQALLNMMQKMENKIEESQKKAEKKQKKMEDKMEESQSKMEEGRLKVERGQVQIAQKLAEKLKESHQILKEKLDASQQVMGAAIEKVKQEMKDKVVALSSDVEDLKTEVDGKMETLKTGVVDLVADERKKIEYKVQLLENKLRTVNTAASVGSSVGSKVKPPTFDGKTQWRMYRRQFEAACEANYWTDEEKATALIIALRGACFNSAIDLGTICAFSFSDWLVPISGVESTWWCRDAWHN